MKSNKYAESRSNHLNKEQHMRSHQTIDDGSMYCLFPLSSGGTHSPAMMTADSIICKYAADQQVERGKQREAGGTTAQDNGEARTKKGHLILNALLTRLDGDAGNCGEDDVRPTVHKDLLPFCVTMTDSLPQQADGT